jgi:hypothetical protein
MLRITRNNCPFFERKVGTSQHCIEYQGRQYYKLAKDIDVEVSEMWV